MNRATNYLFKLIKNENLIADLDYSDENKSFKFDMRSGAKSHFYVYPIATNTLKIEGRYNYTAFLDITGDYETDTRNLLSLFYKDILGKYFESCSLVWLNCLRKYGYISE